MYRTRTVPHRGRGQTTDRLLVHSLGDLQTLSLFPPPLYVYIVHYTR